MDLCLSAETAADYHWRISRRYSGLTFPRLTVIGFTLGELTFRKSPFPGLAFNGLAFW
jgi:hypothetical protein